MLPDNRKPPTLSQLKRQIRSLRKAEAQQTKILLAMATVKRLETQVQDLRDFNAGRIDTNPITGISN